MIKKLFLSGFSWLIALVSWTRENFHRSNASNESIQLEFPILPGQRYYFGDGCYINEDGHFISHKGENLSLSEDTHDK